METQTHRMREQREQKKEIIATKDGGISRLSPVILEGGGGGGGKGI
jgi:hypothetical protein